MREGPSTNPSLDPNPSLNPNPSPSPNPNPNPNPNPKQALVKLLEAGNMEYAKQRFERMKELVAASEAK